jgi:hypothetical protein|tara:strand:- start:5246 stop:7336 length:2091 start_codon:yes stop_codon:yes gene_type:complete
MGQSESGDLRIVGEQKMDPATQQREANLYAKASRLAETNPYSSAYGVGSDLPGMGAMSKAGQQYLTDSILGRGEYAKNLGFTDYTRPEGAALAADATIAASQEAAAAAAAEARAREAAERRRIEGEFGSGPGDEFSKKGAYDTYGGSMGLLTSGSGGPSGYGSSGVGIGEMQDAALATRNMLRERSPNPAGPQRINASSIAPTSVRGSTPIGQSTGSASALRGGGLDRSYAYDTMNAARGGVPPAGVSARSVSPDTIGGPLGVTPGELTERQLSATNLDAFDPSVSSTAIDPLSANAFGGEQIFGGTRSIQDYMNTAGVDAQIAQAKQDYNEALNAEKSRQAQVGAFGARGTVKESGLIGDQERNIAQIRGAGFDRAAQMMEADAGRRQQAGLQSQNLGMESGLAGQALQAQRAESNAARAQQAAMQGQQLKLQRDMQTQQLAQAGDIRNAELGLQSDLQTQQLDLEGQLATQGLDADFERERQRLATQAAMQTQALDSDIYKQEQQLGTQVGLQNAQNEMRVAEQNQQAAIQRNDRQAVLDSQRQMENARMRLEAATRNQSADLQAAGMTYDANAQFRQQQLAAAQQLADIGGMTQDATFAGAGQLRQMGGEQDQIRRMQQAFDYEQWLRGQQGGAQSLALMQGFMPGGAQQQYERAPDLFGQLLGAGTSLAGAGLGAWGARGSTRGSTTGSEGP